MAAGIPGKIIVSEFSLINDFGTQDSTKTNIWPMVIGTSIYETVFRPFMWGIAKIRDSYNLYSTLPITNNTYLKIVLQDPTTGEIIRQIFRVYKVSDIQQESPKLQTYVIHFVSLEMYNSQYIRISKHILGNIPSEVESIHKKISNKSIEVTPDASKTNLYVPYMTAEQAINLLVNNAKWNSAIPDYCYWETFHNFNCKSLMKCMLENPIHDLSTNAKFSTNLSNGFGYDDFIKIDDLVVKQTYDGISSLYSGLDGSTIYSYDPISGQCTANAIGDSPLSRIYNFPDSSLDYKALSLRMQALRSISNSYYYVNVPGLLSRSTGDVTNVTIYNGNNLEVKDTTLSGKRLICGIVHVISADEYNQHITLGTYNISSTY